MKSCTGLSEGLHFSGCGVCGAGYWTVQEVGCPTCPRNPSRGSVARTGVLCANSPQYEKHVKEMFLMLASCSSQKEQLDKQL
jgi:hypothetical protein